MRKKVTTNRRRSTQSTGRLPYLPRKHLLTPGERRFYRFGLLPAVGNRWLIAMKVRLADVITVDDFQGKYGRKISQKHLDFVLITPKTTRIVAAIELNDSTHDEEHRQSRDAFVADSLRDAGVPLIAFPIYRQYEPAIIRHHIQAAVRHRGR